nr:uncharacterized protein LOC109154689 [Ipomoea batatas]
MIPSRMRRETDIHISCGEVLKVQPRTIVHTRVHKGENEESVGSSDDVAPPQGEEASSFHITLCDEIPIEGEDAEEAPLELEEGVRAAIDELKEVDLGTPENPRPIFISTLLSNEDEKIYVELLKEYIDVFAWTYKEMPGLDPKVAVHRLAVKKTYLSPLRKAYLHLHLSTWEYPECVSLFLQQKSQPLVMCHTVLEPQSQVLGALAFHHGSWSTPPLNPLWFSQPPLCFNTSKPTAINETKNHERTSKSIGDLLLNQSFSLDCPEPFALLSVILNVKATEKFFLPLRTAQPSSENCCFLVLPSNCHNEEQREVYRVEQPPERGVNDTAREWVSTRSGRISVVNRASRWRDRRKPWVTMALT